MTKKKIAPAPVPVMEKVQILSRILLLGILVVLIFVALFFGFQSTRVTKVNGTWIVNTPLPPTPTALPSNFEVTVKILDERLDGDLGWGFVTHIKAKVVHADRFYAKGSVWELTLPHSAWKDLKVGMNLKLVCSETSSDFQMNCYNDFQILGE